MSADPTRHMSAARWAVLERLAASKAGTDQLDWWRIRDLLVRQVGWNQGDPYHTLYLRLWGLWQPRAGRSQRSA